jgi:hypothetical protein
MHALTDNNGFVVARGSRARLLAYVERQRRFDPSYALWLDGERVL